MGGLSSHRSASSSPTFPQNGPLPSPTSTVQSINNVLKNSNASLNGTISRRNLLQPAVMNRRFQLVTDDDDEDQQEEDYLQNNKDIDVTDPTSNSAAETITFLKSQIVTIKREMQAKINGLLQEITGLREDLRAARSGNPTDDVVDAEGIACRGWMEGNETSERRVALELYFRLQQQKIRDVNGKIRTIRVFLDQECLVKGQGTVRCLRSQDVLAIFEGDSVLPFNTSWVDLEVTGESFSISHEAIQAVCNSLKANYQVLKKLRLRDLDLTTAHIRDLAEAIRMNRTLTELDLGDNNKGSFDIM
ncbi:hypothetical protein HDU76_000477, partial [Blyttiomyces sp. JEL0837]